MGAGGGSFEGHAERSAGPDREESEFYQTGLNLTFGNFAVGGVFEYFKDFLSFDSGGQDLDIWVAGGGAAYTIDALRWASSTHIEGTTSTTAQSTLMTATASRVALIGDYAMGPGINIDREIASTWIDTDQEWPDGLDDYSGFEIGIGTNFTF